MKQVILIVQYVYGNPSVNCVSFAGSATMQFKYNGSPEDYHQQYSETLMKLGLDCDERLSALKPQESYFMFLSVIKEFESDVTVP
ncbi:MAG: hypothetical protein ACRC62_10000 [Microcoleus sp.]